jgi:hypothetical protein
MKFFILGLAALALVFAGCMGGTVSGKTGTFYGLVTIGPLCPVETEPPNPDCIPTQETFDSYPIVVWNSQKTAQVATIKTDAYGDYSLTLPVGTYIVDLSQASRVGSSNLPATVSITADSTTKLDINIDTGIR